MKILFLVQGEGRGHLTQAIALSQMLRTTDHQIIEVLVGKDPHRPLPSFFEEQINAPVHTFAAPGLTYDPTGSGMQAGRTCYDLLRHAPRYMTGLNTLHKRISHLQPDLIISFYETYSGLYQVIFRPKIPLICIAHQYLLLHPQFRFPPHRLLDRLLLRLHSKSTSWLATQRLALSFRKMAPAPQQKIVVVPPLLRSEVLHLQTTNDGFLLVYMTHHSLSRQIIDWHLAHPEVTLHCFWDNPHVSDTFVFDTTLTFHRINSEKYLRMLATCKALVTTAGFEAVCEAMYLGKPVMMVPVPHHFEQACNALDGVMAGAGVRAQTFDLSILINYLPHHQDQSHRFRTWYHEGASLFLKEIESVAKKTKESKKIPLLPLRLFPPLSPGKIQ